MPPTLQRKSEAQSRPGRQSRRKGGRFRGNVCGRRSQLTLFCAHSAAGPVVLSALPGSNGAHASAGCDFLAADLMAHGPHNFGVDQPIATRKGEPREIGRSCFVEAKCATNLGLKAQAASTKSLRMQD